MDDEQAQWRVHLVSGESIVVDEPRGWDELIAACSATPRTWLRTSDGTLINPQAVTYIQPL